MSRVPSLATRRSAQRTINVSLCLSILVSLLSVAFVGSVSAETTVFRQVRVFDGERTLQAATVLVRDGLIERVVPSGEALEPQSDAVVIEGAGKTLLPGLMDAHSHTLEREALAISLAFGVTTTFDLFTPLELLQSIAAEGSQTYDRADLFSAGMFVTAPGGHGTQFGGEVPVLESAHDADSFIAARIEEGSQYIKLIHDDYFILGRELPTLEVPVLCAAIDAAHERDRITIVHISDMASARRSIECGADGLAHTFVDRLPSEEFLELITDRGTFVVATLSVFQGDGGGPGGGALAADPTLGVRLTAAEKRNVRTRLPGRVSSQVASFQTGLGVVGALHRAGVPILVGTDVPNPGTTTGASVHREMELLVEAGLTPAEALAAATSRIVDAFGLTDRGRIRDGLRADLILVEGDPTQDILATRNLLGVWKLGRRFDVEAFDESRGLPSGPVAD